LIPFILYGAGDGNRTRDRLITNYPIFYFSLRVMSGVNLLSN